MKLDSHSGIPPSGQQPSPSTDRAQTNERVDRTSQINSYARTESVDRSAQGDEINLSKLAGALSSLSADSPEREARVNELARLYAQGRLEVDADAVAERLIDDHIAL